MAVFNKFYLFHSWILWSIGSSEQSFDECFIPLYFNIDIQSKLSNFHKTNAKNIRFCHFLTKIAIHLLGISAIASLLLLINPSNFQEILKTKLFLPEEKAWNYLLSEFICTLKTFFISFGEVRRSVFLVSAQWDH